MEEKKTYVQDFYNNMSDRGEPMIKSCKKGKDYTKISFKPDLSRFGMEVSFRRRNLWTYWPSCKGNYFLCCGTVTG